MTSAWVDSEFPRRLREARMARGLSQTALAGADLTVSFVSHMEAGRRRPSASALALLAERLGVEASELAGSAAAVTQGRVEVDISTAEAHLLAGDVETVERLLAAMDPVAYGGRLRCQLHDLHARLAETRGDLSHAITHLEALRELSMSDPASWPLLPTVVSLCRCYRDAGDLQRAVDLGEQVLALSRDLRLGSLPEWPQTVATIASAYQERGDYERAAMLLDAALAHEPADAKQRGSVAWNASILAAQRGLHADAKRLAELAQMLLVEHADDRAMARLKVLRAWIMMQSPDGDSATAHDLLHEAMERFKQVGSAADKGGALTELSRAKSRLGLHHEAAAYAREALDLLRGSNPIEVARAAIALGASLWAAGEHALAALEIGSAAEALANAAASRQASIAWAELAERYVEQGESLLAADAFRRALAGAGVIAGPIVPADRRSSELLSVLADVAPAALGMSVDTRADVYRSNADH